jgi:hypothetical protein
VPAKTHHLHVHLAAAANGGRVSATWPGQESPASFDELQLIFERQPALQPHRAGRYLQLLAFARHSGEET